MLKNIIIAGAGDYGMELLETILEINQVEPTWNVKGFIDDTLNVGSEVYLGYKVLGSIANWKSPEDFYAIGVARPAAKEKIFTELHNNGAVKFPTIISPRAYISPSAIISDGCIVMRMSSVNRHSFLHEFVTIGASMIGADAEIGSFSTTTGYVNVTNVRVGKSVFIGSHSLILNNLKIGDNAVVAAGSIVVKNVKENTMVFGYPAKRVDL